MGQKTNPIGLRLGVIRSWNSKWFAPMGSKQYRENLLEDLKIREYTRKRFDNADVSQVEIIRSPRRITINIYTARPGVVIGRSGVEIEQFKKELEFITNTEVQLNVLEIKKPELDAYLVAKSIARQIEGRINHRRAIKRAITAAMRMGAKGIKIRCSGRLGGAEIAHSEEYKDGRIPLHTLRADIDFARATAFTTYGTVGVKVWIYKGDILGGMHEYWEKALKVERRERRPAKPYVFTRRSGRRRSRGRGSR
ncbi:MAG TPA: 30S ribosomal protein S3 [candidate division Zixibacteria bacterium]|nr:30S ribosomal protein S3 [candidate division Zixibacteria bacterium]